MRTVSVVAVSVLVLGTSALGAEARGFRLRGSSFSSSRPVSAEMPRVGRVPAVVAVGSIGLPDTVRAGSSLVTRGVMTAEARPPEAAAEEIPPMPPAPPAPLAVKKPAEPWCASGRVAGEGQGFCLIN